MVRLVRRRIFFFDYYFYYRSRRRFFGDILDEELFLFIDDYLVMKRIEEERLRFEEEFELGFLVLFLSRSFLRFELFSLRYFLL